MSFKNYLWPWTFKVILISPQVFGMRLFSEEPEPFKGPPDLVLPADILLLLLLDDGIFPCEFGSPDY